MVSIAENVECRDSAPACSGGGFGGSQFFLRAFHVVLGLLPVAHIYFLIAFTCSNSLAHDYQNIVPTVAAMSEPGYNWHNLVNDTSMGPHCLLSSIILHYCSAHLTDWNARYELYFGAFLAVLRVVLLVDCVGGRWDRLSKWVLLTSFLWLSFGTTICSTLLFGNPCVSAGIGLLGYSAGIWGLTRSKNKKLSLSLVLIGGFVSASFGQFWTLATWSTFLLAIVFCKTRQTSYYVVWLLGCAVSALELAGMAQRPSDFHPRINFVGFINVLGRNFTNDIGSNCTPILQSEIVGIVGLALLIVVGALNLRNRTPLPKLAVPAALAGFGLLGAMIISMSRDAIAPWYSLFAMHFWMGLLAASTVLFQELPQPKKSPSFIRFAPHFFALIPFLIAFGLYLQTNISYKDKDFFRRTHAPCSESAARYFWTAPTYGELALFAGQVGDIRVWHSLCDPLWRHNWAAFAPHQQWSLQGDFLLSSVTVTEQKEAESVKWIDGTKLSRKRHWDDPEQLNLALDLRNSVSWEVSLPQQTTGASLKTAVISAANKNKERTTSNEAAFFTITISELPEKSRGPLECKVFERSYRVGRSWSSVGIPLSPHAGRRLRIRFHGSPSASEKVAVLAYPTIEVDLKKELRTRTQSRLLEVRPSNTELSPVFPAFNANDIVFIADDDSLFRKEGLHAIGKTVDGAVNYKLDEVAIPSLTLAPSISVSPRDYSHFVVEIGASSEVYPRLICLQVVINGTNLKQVLIPMLFDDNLHKYSYDLKLLELESNEAITGLKLLPTYLDKTGECKVRSIRFIRKVCE